MRALWIILLMSLVACGSGHTPPVVCPAVAYLPALRVSLNSSAPLPQHLIVQLEHSGRIHGADECVPQFGSDAFHFNAARTEASGWVLADAFFPGVQPGVSHVNVTLSSHACTAGAPVTVLYSVAAVPVRWITSDCGGYSGSLAVTVP